MQLALKLGYASPGKMLTEMRPSELGLWRALYNDDPWTEDRADLRAAEIATAVANYAGKVRSGEPAKPLDFMPFMRERTKQAGGSSVAQQIRSFLKAPTRKE